MCTGQSKVVRFQVENSAAITGVIYWLTSFMFGILYLSNLDSLLGMNRVIEPQSRVYMFVFLRFSSTPMNVCVQVTYS